MKNSTTQPGEMIDARPLGSALLESRHTNLVDSDAVKIKRMVLAQGQELPEHKAPGQITVQCIEGCIAFSTGGSTVELEPGQLVCLPAGTLHAVRAIQDSSFLLTIFLGNRT